MSILVLVPSRGRPERAFEMARLFGATAELPDTRLLFIVDGDDPQLQGYTVDFAFPPESIRILDERLGYTGSLNLLARSTWNEVSILGAFGDDVAFRTPGWDRMVESTLATPGIAYGDDLIHGVNHPSAVFMSSIIARALGWLALPATTHQWADDGWKRLGQELELLRFMPEVIVEHLHPAVGKAEWDTTYREVFDAQRAKGDHDGFDRWARGDGLRRDARKVRVALHHARRK